MSTFVGTLPEFPRISVDRFDGSNLDSDAFFLSHCHSDHMVGLDVPAFHRKLSEDGCVLYVSHVSGQILKSTFPNLRNIVELDLHTPSMMSLPESKPFSVTAIPAGHCPGSVMFLFEGDQTVLYTGDFRINRKDLPKFKAFYDSSGRKKRIDAIYLDTTFFLKSYSRFPSRVESLEAICSVIEEWICHSDKHVVALSTCARYGYEYLFLEIYKHFKMPIHVNEEAYELYSRFPDLDGAVTRDNRSTKIHSACGSTYGVICQNTIAYKIKTIKVSAFRWRSEDLEEGFSKKMGGVHYVCYSTHASYEEVAEMLKFLEPKKVEANVLHHNEWDKELRENINQFLEVKEPRTKMAKLFDVSRRAKKEEEETVDGLYAILDSPPRSTNF